MWAILKQLWLDPVYFATSVKGLGQTLGALVGTGVIPTNGPLWKWGFVFMALCGFIPTARPTVLNQVKAMTPIDKAEVHTHLTGEVNGGMK